MVNKRGTGGYDLHGELSELTFGEVVWPEYFDGSSLVLMRCWYHGCISHVSDRVIRTGKVPS